MAVGEARGVVRVLPPLVLQATVARPEILDVAITVTITELVDPLQRAVGGRQQRVDLLASIAPALELTEQHDEQRRRIDAPVVDAPAAERQLGGLAEAHLVEDPPGLLLGDRVHVDALVTRQGLERAEREIGVDHHRHPRREQAVAAEEGHEPRRARGHDRAIGMLGIEEPERGEVLVRTVEEGAEPFVLGGDRGQAPQPRLEARDGRRPLDRTAAQVTRRHLLPVDDRRELQAHRPVGRGRHEELEARVTRRQRRGLREVEVRAPAEVATPVRPGEAVAVDVGAQVADLLDAAFLHLEQVGEVGADGELERAERRLEAVIADGDVFPHAPAHVAVTEDHEPGVGFTDTRLRAQHERGAERVGGGRRQRLGPLAVHPEAELGEEARVTEEDAVGEASEHVARRRGDRERGSLDQRDRATLTADGRARRHRPRLRHSAPR